MQTTSNKGGAPAWVWKFFFCLLGGIAYETAVYYLSGIVPEEYSLRWLVGAGLVLWAACAWMGWRRAPFMELVGAVAGLVWGLMAAFPVLVRMEDPNLPVNWAKLGVGFIVVPVLVLVTILPFWFMGKKPAAAG